MEVAKEIPGAFFPDFFNPSNIPISEDAQKMLFEAFPDTRISGRPTHPQRQHLWKLCGMRTVFQRRLHCLCQHPKIWQTLFSQEILASSGNYDGIDF